MKFLQKLFSVTNEYNFYFKRKVLCIFGVKIKIGKKFLEYKNSGKNNKIYLKDNNILKLVKRKYHNLHISFEGDNNKIIIDKMFIDKCASPHAMLCIRIEGNENSISLGKFRKMNGNIYIFGHNNTLEIDDTIYNLYYNIHMGCLDVNEIPHRADNSIKIGKNCSMGPIRFFVYNKNTNITIAHDCMFSSDVTMQAPDGHPIYNKAFGEIINKKPYSIEIGSHVWIARGAYILKNAKIPPNTIIGGASVVTKKFDEQYTIIAGNPAHVVKRGVEWDRESAF